MNTEKLAIPFAIIIAGALIGGSLYFSNVKLASTAKTTQKASDTTTTAKVGDIRPVSSTTDHILGNPDAQILLVEYSDTECPYCKMFQPTLQKIIAEYGPSGKVAWVYRHFPIDSLHPKSRKEAEATECANELGGPTKFWQYINMVYDKTPGNNGLDPAQLPVFAKAVGLDVTAFNACLASGKYAGKVEADYEDAIASYGNDTERGTPHTILITKDGVKTPINGTYPYEQMKTIIDSLLK